MATIVHFDISADDPKRAKDFYEKLFGWDIRQLPGPMDYFMVGTADLQNKPGIGGGISRRDANSPAGIINYIGVSSIDETLEQVSEAGGTIITGKQDVPGYGQLAICTDTEGNVFGIFREKP